MAQSLNNKFYIKFLINLFTTICGISLFLVVLVLTFTGHIESNNKIYLILIMFVVLLILTVLAIRGLIPFIKDFKAVKYKQFESITGTVITRKKRDLGGEPPTTIYNPIVKDIETSMEIELKVEGAQINKTYTFLYLKNTKLAIIEKIQETM